MLQVILGVAVWHSWTNCLSGRNVDSISIVMWPLQPWTSLTWSWQVEVQKPSSNVMTPLQQRCGADIATASAACRHDCLNALDSERLLCAQDPTYLAYVPIKAACAGATARAQCADTASLLTTMTDSVCCVDQDCTDLPAECTPECAATFMPFFSRCGMQIFGADPTTLAKFQGFERKCANAVGRDVDLAAAIAGPDPQDPCSANTDCSSCMGLCGWCRNEISDRDVLKQSGGGWCAGGVSLRRASASRAATAKNRCQTDACSQRDVRCSLVQQSYVSLH
jgi:hypothetical protein